MRLRPLYLLSLSSLVGGNAPLTTYAADPIVTCKPAIYSLADRQISFSTLAVETYLPFEDTVIDQYTLCTGQEGTPIILKSDPGYGDFYFPSHQNLDCPGQLIDTTANCYPIYSAKHFSLTFPEIKIPWAIVLPDGKQMATRAFCYQVSLAKNPSNNRFNLSTVEAITCP